MEHPLWSRNMGSGSQYLRAQLRERAEELRNRRRKGPQSAGGWPWKVVPWLELGSGRNRWVKYWMWARNRTLCLYVHM